MAKSLCFRRKERPHGHPLFFLPRELRQNRDAIYRRQCPLCDALHPLTASLLLHLRIYHNMKARSFTKSQIMSSFEKVPAFQAVFRIRIHLSSSNIVIKTLIPAVLFFYL
jgi:hypothetical protein